jgi:putative membrane protein
MLIAALVLAGLAALVHVYIFVLETLRWEAPRTRQIFGLSEREAAITKPLAANQGVYNLMLGIVTAVGIVLAVVDLPSGGALIFAGTGSMFVAAMFLVVSDRSKLRPALVQGTLPLLAILALIAALAVG